MNQEEITRNSLYAGEKSSAGRQSFVSTTTSATGFLSRLLHPNLIISRFKSKCREYKRYSPSQAVYSALQKKTTENVRNENGKSKILSVKLIRLDLA